MNINLDRLHSSLTSTYWRIEYHDQMQCPKNVLSALVKELPQFDPSTWPQRQQYGGIYLNGRKTLLENSLTTPCKIEYYEPKHSLQTLEDLYNSFEIENYILFEDEHLIAVWKPAKIDCLAAKEQQVFFLQKLIEQHCKTKIHMPSRLDHSTCGILVASKSTTMHPLLQKSFEQRLPNKNYILASDQTIEWTNKTIETAIGRDPRHRILRMPSTSSGKAAQTNFQVLHTTCKGTSFILAKPKTGRTHQIRVHAAYNGFPIIGDNFYGGSIAEDLHLCSIALKLKHPITGKMLNFTGKDLLYPNWLKQLPIDISKISM